MTFSKKNLLTLSVLSVLWGCSGAVDGTKDPSVVQEASGAQRMKVLPLEVVDSTPIRDERSREGLVKARAYTLKACFEDVLRVKSMVGRTVTLENGKTVKTDTKGCVTWQKVVEVDYKNKQNCNEFSHTAKMEGVKGDFTSKYVIDPLDDKVSDLQLSQGCLIKGDDKGGIEAFRAESELVLKTVELYPGTNPLEATVNTKNLVYTAKYDSCIASYTSGKNLRSTDISIEVTEVLKDENGSESKGDVVHTYDRTTDLDGCFKHYFQDKYEQFSWSQWKNYDFKVTVTSGPLAGMSQTRRIHANPWEQSRTVFAASTHPVYGYGKVEINPLAYNQQVQLDGIMYILIGNDNENFKVNDYLGLTVSRSYQVVLYPRVDRGKRFTEGQPRYIPIKDGDFELSFMILAPKSTDIPITTDNFKDFQFITGATKDVKVKNGVINDILSLQIKVNDLTKLATRAVTVFKLKPKYEVGLEGAVVTGFFKAKIPWIKTNAFKPDTLNMSDEAAGFGESSNKHDLGSDVNAKFEVSSAEIEQWKADVLLGSVKESDYESPLGPKKVNEIGKKYSEKQVAFKRYIEFLFANINELTDKRSYNNPFKADSKEMFVRHLQKYIPEIDVIDTESLKEKHNIKVDKEMLEHIVINNAPLNEGIKKQLCENAFGKDHSGTHLERHFGQNQKVKTCMRHFEKFYDIKRYRHASNVSGVSDFRSTGKSVGIGARMNWCQGSQEQVWRNWRLGAFDLATKFDPLNLITAGLRMFDIGVGKSWSDYINDGQCNDISEFSNVGVEIFNLKVEADYEDCVLIHGKTYNTYIFNNNITYVNASVYKNETIPLKAYVCNEPELDNVYEDWYYMQEYTTDTSILRDPFGPAEVRFMKVIRGEHAYKEVVAKLTDINKRFLVMGTTSQVSPDRLLLQNWEHLVSEPQIDEDDKGFLILDLLNGSFPGTMEIKTKVQSTRTGFWNKWL